MMQDNTVNTNGMGGGSEHRKTYSHRPYNGVGYWPTPKAFRHFGNEPPVNYPIKDVEEEARMEQKT